MTFEKGGKKVQQKADLNPGRSCQKDYATRFNIYATDADVW